MLGLYADAHWVNDVTPATEFQREHSLRQANRSYVLPVESAHSEEDSSRDSLQAAGYRRLEFGEGITFEESPSQHMQSTRLLPDSMEKRRGPRSHRVGRGGYSRDED